MGNIGKDAETTRDSGGEPGKAGTGATRQERLSAAMRENLKRRKAQARGRAGSAAKSTSADKQSERA